MNEPINKYEILHNIKEQIIAFDNKAGILVSILGLIFGLSFTALEVISSSDNKWYIYILFILFDLSLAISIFLALSVIIPRKRKSKTSDASCTYYIDLVEMSELVFNELIKTENHFEQIKQNAKIACRKHKYLRATIYSLIADGILFFGLVISLLVK